MILSLKEKSSRIFWFLARIFVGLVFAYAGFTKLTEPIENFRGVLAQYEVIPYALLPFIAFVVPWLELIAGVFMILGYAPRLAAIATTFLCLNFLIVLGASNALLDSGSKDCGCFGEGSLIHLTVHQIFVLDFLNMLLSLKLASRKFHPLSLDNLLRSDTSG